MEKNAPAATEKEDSQNLGLFKETLAVMFGLHQKTIDRVMAIVSNSEDKLNVKTYIARDKAGPRAVKYMRLAIEYARHEGSQKHEDGSDDFERTKEADIESTARGERPQRFDEPEPTQDDTTDMDKPIKECTFRDYLMELQVSDDPSQAMQDVKTAARNPDRFQKQQAENNVSQEREVKGSEDPNKAEKLKILQMRKQTQQKEKMLQQKEKRSEQELGIRGATAERPGTGLM